jgi:D-methionine transport system substrate-binding protein
VVSYIRFADLNKALAKGEIDANIFQTHFYAEYSEHEYGYHLSELGQTYIYPIGIYSKKIKNILQLEKGALIAIPSEPTNETRALFLLEKAGLIRMKSNNDMDATVDDIAANPKDFQIVRLPAREVAGMMPNVDIAVINISYALPAGLVPYKDAIVLENGMTNYANVVVVREGEEKDPRLVALMEVLRSEEIEKAVEKIFHGQAIPAWK